MEMNSHAMLGNAWFGLIGLMLIFYVVTDGFDLGVGILSLFTRREQERNLIFQSIAHVWDANETWLVVVGGALFGAFPSAYATLLEQLYIPIMLLIASLIMRGASIEFRHAAGNKRLWDLIFGVGSLLAAVAQGVVLGKVITGLQPGPLSAVFTACTALGVVAGYCLLGSTYLIKKTGGLLEAAARRYATTSVLATVAAAIVLSAGTMVFSAIGHDRWAQPGVFGVLLALAAVAASAFIYILWAVHVNGVRGPFRGAIVLFLASFAGLAISFFPDLVPGKLSIAAAASDEPTLIFMLIGMGSMLPIMIGYNLFQYYVFEGKVVPRKH
jgi:cytochrome d ubiquinol oxidase subunit II